MKLIFKKRQVRHIMFQNISVSSKWAPNQRIRMISEGSCDTEDWAENSALHHRNKLYYTSLTVRLMTQGGGCVFAWTQLGWIVLLEVDCVIDLDCSLRSNWHAGVSRFSDSSWLSGANIHTFAGFSLCFPSLQTHWYKRAGTERMAL